MVRTDHAMAKTPRRATPKGKGRKAASSARKASAKKATKRATPKSVKKSAAKDPKQANDSSLVQAQEGKIVLAHNVGSHLVGASLTRHPLVFSRDSKMCFCVQGLVVRVIAVKTGLTVGVLSGHTARVTSIAVNPSNEFQLLSASLDGTIKAWDYVDAVCLRQWDLARPVYNLTPIAGIPSTVALVFSGRSSIVDDAETGTSPGGKSDAPAAWTVVPFDMKTHRLYDAKAIKLKSDALPAPRVRGATLVVADGNSLYLWHLNRGLCETVHHSQQITAVSIHPREGVISVGDASGKITNIYCLTPAAANDDGEVETSIVSMDIEDVKHTTIHEPITSVYHWHSHAVLSLSHCTDESYLLSGGSEGVLVQWEQQQRKPEFLPRLGGSILHISSGPSSELYGVCCSDNSVVLISSTSRKELWRIRGLAAASSRVVAHSFRKTGLVIDPVSHCLVANDLEGTGNLQLFDIESNSHAATIPVTLQNFVVKHPGQGQSLKYSALVNKVAFSSDGSILATLDYHRGIQKLKFWHRTEPPQGADTGVGTVNAFFALNTVVDAPHSKDVESMAYHPSRHVLATASKDGKCKVWECRALSQEADQEKGALPGASSQQNAEKKSTQASASSAGGRLLWRCRSTCEYRGLPANAIAFAEDGSILAIAFGNNVTLWNPHTNTLLHVLPHQPNSERLRHLGFLKGSSPFLVACSTKQVCVWNLLTLSLWWSHTDLPQISSFALHPVEPRFAIGLKLYGKTSAAPAGKQKEHTRKRRRADVACSISSSTNNGDNGVGPQPSGLVLSFNAHDRSPDTSQCMDHDSGIESLSFVKTADGSGKHRLLVCDTRGRILDTKASAKTTQVGLNKAAAAASEQSAQFQSIFGASGRRGSASNHSTPSATSTVGSKKLAALLDSPSHIVAAPSTLFAALMQILMQRQEAPEPKAADGAKAKKLRGLAATSSATEVSNSLKNSATATVARAFGAQKTLKPKPFSLSAVLASDKHELPNQNWLDILA